MVHRAEPIIWPLPETVQTLLELRDKRHSGLVDYFVARGHLGENVFLHVGIQKCRLNVCHKHLLVQFRRDRQHHADALKSAYGGEGAVAVDCGDLRPNLYD